MTEQKERFLQAEELANRLATQLQELKHKIDTHEESISSLNEARITITSLASEIAEMTQGIPLVISKLSEIGTPTIIESVDASRREIEKLLGTDIARTKHFLRIAITLGAANLFGFLVLLVLTILVFMQLR